MNIYSMHLFDNFSISHVIAGMFYTYIFKYLEIVFMINVLFEIIENSNFDYKKVLDIGNPKLWDMIPLILYFIIF